jgi:hypothetical protein
MRSMAYRLEPNKNSPPKPRAGKFFGCHLEPEVFLIAHRSLLIAYFSAIKK